MPRPTWSAISLFVLPHLGWQALTSVPNHWLRWILQTYCPGLPWTSVLLISASQVARIAGLHHHSQLPRAISDVKISRNKNHSGSRRAFESKNVGYLTLSLSIWIIRHVALQWNKIDGSSSIMSFKAFMYFP
jgi:hypothetical protein